MAQQGLGEGYGRETETELFSWRLLEPLGRPLSSVFLDHLPTAGPISVSHVLSGPLLWPRRHFPEASLLEHLQDALWDKPLYQLETET